MSYAPLTAGDLRLQELPRKVMILAEALSKKHGEILVARETSGLHLYMASPKALEEDGWIELEKRHLAVNVDKHFAGAARQRRGAKFSKGCAKCMKYDKVYTVEELLAMPSIEQRGYVGRAKRGVKIHSLERELVSDGKGNMIPPPPGEVIAITQLPQEHPAVWYLKYRNYNLARLEQQFRCAFCTKEWLNKDGRAPYRRLPGGFRDTPQNRIVFFGDINGVQRIWQARIPEFVVEEGSEVIKYYLHPYTNEWTACERKNLVTKKWEPLDHLIDDELKWDVSKYRTALYAAKAESLIGLDAAVDWNRRVGAKKPTAILVEGPLDAGRIGPPAIAMIGKSLSEAQATLLIKNFRRVIFISDNDIAGAKSRRSVVFGLGRHVELIFMDAPSHVKDVGELTDDEAAAYVGPKLFYELI